MNACDLEETKHLALQKFLEFSHESGWKRGSLFGGLGRFHRGKFQVYSDFRNEERIAIYLNSDVLFLELGPSHPDTKDALGNKSTFSDYEAAVEEYNKKLAVFKSGEYMLAFLQIQKAVEERERQEQCEQMKRNIEESCIRIKQELAVETASPIKRSFLSFFRRDKRKHP